MINMQVTVKTLQNLEYHGHFKNSQLKRHNKVANFIKWMIQTFSSSLERKVRYILHLGEKFRGTTLSERLISVRVNSIKDVYGINYLMLGRNKNFKYYRKSLIDMATKHSDAHAILLCSDDNGVTPSKTSQQYAYLGKNIQNKCITYSVLHQHQNGMFDYKNFYSYFHIDNMVNNIFENIVNKEDAHFKDPNCKEIKIFMETPPLMEMTSYNGLLSKYPYIY